MEILPKKIAWLPACQKNYLQINTFLANNSNIKRNLEAL